MDEPIVENIGLAIQFDASYGQLPPGPAALFQSCRSAISSQWPGADEAGRRRLAGYSGVLDRLSGTLLQLDRIRHGVVQMLQFLQPGGDPSFLQVGQMFGLSMATAAGEAGTDFESLLFHARAALDRLTKAVSQEYPGQLTDRYKKLENVLSNASDERAAVLLSTIRAVSVAGVLTDDETTCLRSRVTHHLGIAEGTTSNFEVRAVGSGRVLLFDCEALGYGVLTTAHELAQTVPHIVLSGVATYLGLGSLPPLAEYEPPWENRATVFSEFVSDGGPVFSVRRFTPDGWTQDTQHLEPTVLERAFELSDWLI